MAAVRSSASERSAAAETRTQAGDGGSQDSGCLFSGSLPAPHADLHTAPHTPLRTALLRLAHAANQRAGLRGPIRAFRRGTEAELFLRARSLSRRAPRAAFPARTRTPRDLGRSGVLASGPSSQRRRRVPGAGFKEAAVVGMGRAPRGVRLRKSVCPQALGSEAAGARPHFRRLSVWGSQAAESRRCPWLRPQT